jgi:Zn-dependent protease/predicted transcriptional regulator
MLTEKRITLFRLAGFRVQIEWSWLLLAVWLTWSLVSNVFPSRAEGLSTATYWWMGLTGALGLFASIVFHELCHSLVARRYGLPIKGITLFIFGGVAELEDDPPSAKTEFLMALAGPASSAVLGLALYGLRAMAQGVGGSRSVIAVIGYLASINTSLAGFNLLPAFPLDGGRVLRAALWRWRQDIRWATRVASWIGSLLGNLLMALGAITLFLGDVVDSMWLIVIGLYLKHVSQTSYRQLLIRLALQGERVSRFMQADPVTVSSHVSVAELVESYVYRYHFKMFPVVDDNRLVGCVSARAAGQVPQTEWEQRTVGEIAITCSTENTVAESADAMQALAKMGRTGNSRLVVVNGDRLVGVITLKDLLQYVSMRLDLDQGMPTA